VSYSIVGKSREETYLDLLHLRPLVVLQLRHLALDPLDVGLRILVLSLGLLDLRLKLSDSVLERFDFADDLRSKNGEYEVDDPRRRRHTLVALLFCIDFSSRERA
jgi:hypothetical protein